MLTNERATAAQFDAALWWLVDECQAGDEVVIYFSGHGDVERRSLSQPGFLLCWDAPAHAYTAGGTYSLYFLKDIISTLSVQNKVKVTLITDACRAGKLAGSSIGGAQATAANLREQYANEIKILSCQPDEYSLEGEQWGGGRGAFSYHLVDGLYGLADRNSDGTVNLMELRGYLEERVSEEVAPESQLPMTVGNGRQELAQVYPELLEELQQGRRGRLQMFTATESRGIEDEVLNEADSNVVDMYLAFQQAIADGQFLEPQGACADHYYEKLSREPQLERLHSSMRRNYAAALQDDAQQVMNEWMKTSDDQLQEAVAGDRKGRLPIKVFTEKVRSFPRLLERAAELLGQEHYMYAVLQARRYFFEGYLLTNSDRNPNQALGEQALTAFRKALDRQAELPQAYWQMSKVHGYNLLQPDSAEVYSQKAMELSPSWVRPYADLAFMLSEKYKQFDRAKPWLEKAMQLDSNSLYVRNSWGTYFVRKKEYLKAEQQYKKAIRLDSTFVNAYHNLGNVYLETRRYDEAEQQLKKAIRLDSTFLNAYINLGNDYRDARRYDEAEQQYKKAIRIDSSYAFAYANLAVLRSLQNQTEAAFDNLEKALKNSFNFYVAIQQHSDLAPLREQKERWEALMQNAIVPDTTDARAWNRLGQVYIQAGNYAPAEAAMRKAVALDATSAPYRSNLGYIYLKLARYAEAEAAFTQAITLDSAFANARKHLGTVCFKTKRPEEAKQHFQKALELKPDYTGAMLGMAYVLTGEGKTADPSAKAKATAEAIGYVEQAIGKGSTFEQLEADEDLAPLREQAGWKGLMQKHFPDQVKSSKE